MSRKVVNLPYKILDAVPLNASFNSKLVNVQYQDNIAFQISITTTANTGVFSILVSIDGTIWDTLPLSPAIPALANVNDVFTIDLNQVPYTWLMLHFELGTGTNGTVTAFVTGKGI